MDTDDTGQSSEIPGVGVTAAQLLRANRTAHGFEIEVAEPAEVLEWRPPMEAEQGRMPAAVKVRATLKRARKISSSRELEPGEEADNRYGTLVAVRDGPTYDEIPVYYGLGPRGPLPVGSTGWIIAVDADTGAWKRRGALQFPELPGRHQLRHGFFLPGARTGSDLDYQVPEDETFTGSDDLSAGFAVTNLNTSSEVRGLTIKIGANAVEPAVLGQQLSTLLQTATTAAITAAAPIVPPNGDGGTAAFTAFQTALVNGLANIFSQIVTIE